MNTETKKAIELMPGDYIRRIEDRPNIHLYRGVVKTTVVVDRGVQINYEGGMHVVTGEATPVEVDLK